MIDCYQMLLDLGNFRLTLSSCFTVSQFKPFFLLPPPLGLMTVVLWTQARSSNFTFC